MSSSNKRFYALWLCLACIVIFIIQLIIPSFTETFMLTPDALSRPWQFLTAVFLHGGIAHLLYNLVALLMFGLVLEQTIGSRKFIVFYLLAGIIANIFSFLVYPNQSALGASGAIMGIIGVVAVLKPTMTIWLYSLPMPMFVGAIVWIAGSVLGIFGFGDQGVGHLAHLSGILVGLIYGFYLRLRYYKKSAGVYQNSRIIIPEDSMRSWEDSYMGR